MNLLLVGDSTSGVNLTRIALEAAGHTTTFVTETNFPATDLSPYDAVVAARMAPTTAATTIALRAAIDSGKPLILSTVFTGSTGTLARQENLLRLAVNSTMGSAHTEIEVVDNTHDLVASLSVGRHVVAGNFHTYVSGHVGDAVAQADPEQSATEANVVAIESGTLDLDGVALNARIVLMGYVYAGQLDYTVAGAHLLDRAVAWVTNSALPGYPPVKARLSRVAAEVLVQENLVAKARLSRTAVEVLVIEDPPPVPPYVVDSVFRSATLDSSSLTWTYGTDIEQPLVDDLLLAVIQAGSTLTIPTPTGFTPLRSDDLGGSTTALFFRIADGSETTFFHDYSNQYWWHNLIIVRGADTASPFESIVRELRSGKSVAMPEVFTWGDNRLSLNALITRDSSGTNDVDSFPSAPWALVHETGGYLGVNAFGSEPIANSSVTPARTLGISAGSSNPENVAAYTIIIPPSGGAVDTQARIGRFSTEVLRAGGLVDAQVGRFSTEVLRAGGIVDLQVGRFSTEVVWSDPTPLRGAAPAPAVSGSTALVIPVPGSVQPDDVMLAQVSTRGDILVTPPAGWDLLRRDGGTTSSDAAQHIFVRESPGGEPASYTWTLSATTNASGGMVVHDGVRIPSPVDVHDGLFASGVTTITAPELTPTVEIFQIVNFFAAWNGTAAQTITDDSTNNYSVNGNSASRSSRKKTNNGQSANATGSSSLVATSVALAAEVQPTLPTPFQDGEGNPVVMHVWDGSDWVPMGGWVT